MRSINAGFSLIELLVTFVLLSIIMGLLSQTFSVFLKAYFQTDALEAELLEEQIYSTWFRDSLSSAVPFSERSLSFYGGESNIRFATADSLSGPQGEIKVVTWNLDSSSGMTSLLYSENGSAPVVLVKWKGSDANFSFRGESSGWQKTWPSELASPGLLPRKVKVSVDGETEHEIFVGIITRELPRYDYRDLL